MDFEIARRDLTLEVLSLFIPNWVETDQISKIAQLLARVDDKIPFTILAFFGEYKMKDVPSPNLKQMLDSCNSAREAGLKNVRLGNIGIFVKTEEDYKLFLKSARDGL